MIGTSGSTSMTKLVGPSGPRQESHQKVRPPIAGDSRDRESFSSKMRKNDRSLNSSKQEKHNPSVSNNTRPEKKRTEGKNSQNISSQPKSEIQKSSQQISNNRESKTPIARSDSSQQSSSIQQERLRESEGNKPGEGVKAHMAPENSAPAVPKAQAQVEFLQTMKSKLGVEPKQVVKAFSELSDSELAQPPEKSVDTIIENLGLEGEEAENARKMFYGMLAQTAAVDLAADVNGQNNKLSMEVLTQRESAKRELDQSIDGLQKSFFGENKKVPVNQMHTEVQTPSLANSAMRRQAAKNAYMNAAMNQAQRPVSTNVSQGTQGEEGGVEEGGIAAMSMGKLSNQRPGNSPLPMSHGTASADLPTNSLNSPNGIDISSLKSENMGTMSKMESVMAEEMIQAPKFDSSMMSMSAPEGSTAAALQTSANNMDATQEMSELGAEESMKIASAEGGLKSQLEGEGEYSEGQEGMKNFGEVQVTSKNQLKETGKSNFVIQSPSATESDRAANMREVVNQARYMIKEGGGEMKIRLAPEGLGDVNLKVSMLEGKINVEMVTSNTDAKKLMEDGLGDLKSTLASLKVELEDVKVDVARSASNQLEQDASDDAREFQQRFLHEFQRENRNNRQGFFADPFNNDSQTGERAKNAHEVSLGNNGKKPKDGSARRLNLVA